MKTYTNDNSSMIDRVQAMPRATRWGVYGLVIIVLLTIYAYPVLGLSTDWNARADRAQEALNRTRDPLAARRPVDQVRGAIELLGPLETPANEIVTSKQLESVVNEIVKRYIVSKYSHLIQAPSKLSQGKLRGVVRSNQQAQEIRSQVEFEADEHDAAKIIAELEASDAIELISGLRIQKVGQGRVSVRLTLESWVISAASAAGTRGRR